MYVEIQAIGRPHVSLPDGTTQGLECAAQWLGRAQTRDSSEANNNNNDDDHN